MNPSTLAGMGSSGAGDAATPRDFFLNLDREFHFNLDLAAAPGLTMVPGAYYSPAGFHVFDTLVEARSGGAFEFNWWIHPFARLADRHRPEPVVGWLNPPYGRDLVEWIRKAQEAAYNGAIVVALLPARTDTEWYSDHVAGSRNVEVRLVEGRIPFGCWSPKGEPLPLGAPGFFPSILAIFRPWRMVRPYGDPERADRESTRLRAAEVRQDKREERRLDRIRRRTEEEDHKASAIYRARLSAGDAAAVEAERLAGILRGLSGDLGSGPVPLEDAARLVRTARKVVRPWRARRKVIPPAAAPGADPGQRGGAEAEEGKVP